MKGTTAAEAERERAAVVRISGLDASAIVRKPAANRNARAPLLDDDPPSGRHEADARAIVAQSIDRLGDQANTAATIKDLFEIAVSLAIETGLDGTAETRALVGKLEAKHAAELAAHRTELAELKLALTEARCEVREMRSIQESARTLSRGEQGVAGPRGSPGPSGARGDRGERGEAGARAASFLVNPGDYSAALLLSDGSPGAQLRLRPLFERFAEEIASEDAEAGAD